ncbi:hypothetical protein GCM10008018_51650 [Paenibacillus marchantiophytorum]|uniref:DUF1275 domain-containing protein n=1 Tax=Paenibacillus marchantiophytorum TaxID=1619310 RepID=A0ABQ1F479_9BACL|nr:hypothetical protein [Paenibacillus marchantiophytorum]GFZ99127.1 hypothetical protein GCM10008018_51650 [Paenibacillus marchantiophytorum]
MAEQKSERKFHFMGVLLGVAVDNLGTYISTALFGSIYFAGRPVNEEAIKAIYSNIGLLFILMVMGLFWSFFGGFIAAKVAKRAEYFNAAIIGVIGAAIGFDSMLTDHGVPLWFELIGFVVIIPISLLGGYVALKRKKAPLK